MNKHTFTPPPMFNGQPFVYQWAYLPEDESALPLGYVVRYQNGSGEKETPPLFRPGKKRGTFTFGAHPVPRPLFGLHTLKREGPIFIVEGEKDASALHMLGLAAITSQGGSSSAKSADWNPIEAPSKNRPIIIWPDNDEPGKAYAAGVVHLIGACQHLPKPPDGTPTTKGAGAADWLAAEMERHNMPPWDGLQPVALDPEQVRQFRQKLLQAVDAIKTAGPIEGVQRSEQKTQTKPVDLAARGIVTNSAQAQQQEARVRADALPYLVASSGTYRLNMQNGVETNRKKLANFSARIIEEVTHDDGTDEQSRAITVTGQRNDLDLPPISMTYDKFAKMAWPANHWGTGCLIYPGNGNKEHLCHAIQALSHQDNKVVQKTVYTHTGWKKINGQWLYLSAGEVIGAHGSQADVNVDLGELSKLYQLPEPSTTPEQARHAAQASMATLNTAPLEVTIPLLAAIYLAPMSQALEVDFAVWLQGPSQAYKSSLAGMMAGHFGPQMGRKGLTASFADTANAIGEKLFMLSDCITIVDDYAPKPCDADMRRQKRTVSDVVRNIGNLSGRGRMTANCDLRNTRAPRGMVIVTAELWPDGESINARLFGLSIRTKQAKLTPLTESQHACSSGLLSRAMSDHLQRFAGEHETRIERAKTQLLEYRGKILATGIRGRSPEQMAFLLLGYDQALESWQAAGAINSDQANARKAQAWAVMESLALESQQRTKSAQPAEAFVETLRDLLLSGGAHLRDQKGGAPLNSERYGWSRSQPNGMHIGWLDSNASIIYLLEKTVTQAVNMALTKAGESLGMPGKQLWEQMKENGYLLTGEYRKDTGKERPTKKVCLEGIWTRVLLMPTSTFDAVENGE